jgi:hypothetical protein
VSAEQIAAAHQKRRKELARRAADEIAKLWARIDPADIARSWASSVPAALTVLSSAQAIAAGAAGGYLDELAEAYDVSAESAGQVRAAAFAGTASDGRSLASLLYEPAITSLSALKQGAPVPRALTSGRFALDMITRTQVADTGRAADQVAMVTHKQMAGYVRVLSPPSCSRCVILAGKFYRWNTGFQRHPRCDCTHQPVTSAAAAGDELVKPRSYFDSLDAAGQDRAFGKAGAEAIRQGADISQVVNARRGMQTATLFGRKTLVTTEGTTTRGLAGRRLGARQAETRQAGDRYRRATRVRLMPEQILHDARDRDDAIRLLHLHGYIIGPGTAPIPLRASDLARKVIAPRRPALPVPTFEQRLAAATRDEKALDTTTFMLGRKPRPDAFTVEMSRAVNTYTGAEYNAINRLLRGQTLPYGYRAEDVTQTIADLDAAMAASRVDRDVVTYRGVIDATKIFGNRLAGDLTGMTWREDAFVSTTAKARTADMFTEATADSPVVMRFLVPAGTPAVGASSWAIEAEILLARGRTLRVAADRGLDPHGIRHIDVEVLP